MSFEHLSIAEVHVYTARQAGVETPHCAHNVYALEFVRAIFLKEWCVLHCILVRPWCSVNVPWVCVPRRRRIGMVIGVFAVANDTVMRQNAAPRLVEAAADGILRNGELRPRPGSS